MIVRIAFNGIRTALSSNACLRLPQSEILYDVPSFASFAMSICSLYAFLMGDLFFLLFERLLAEKIVRIDRKDNSEIHQLQQVAIIL